MVREATKGDGGAICEIYNYYILHSTHTFEEQTISSEEMAKRMFDIQENYPWLVFEEGTDIAGYAYACKWKGRAAYRLSAEITVYIKNGYIGKQIGSKLYQSLLDQLKDMDLHTVIGGIALPNDHSIAFHEKFGFKKVAHFREVGYKFKKWIDVGYWQKFFK